MAEVKPFRAVRYDEGRVGSLESVVAPPYDVIGPEQRSELLARSPYNVVHLTLPDSEEEAARLYGAWQNEGVLVRDEEPAAWVVSQDYVGPDGVARTRTGIVASLRAEPYETRAVLPHERTHSGPKEGRLRLLRATGVQLEPIFLLHDGPPPLRPPDREPDLAVEGARLWRVEDPDSLDALADRELLIADGHHRYETAVAFAQDGGSPQLMVVLVSTEDEGLEIFPTHRVFARRPDGVPSGEAYDSPDAALEALAAAPRDRPRAVVYAGGRAELASGEPGQLDVEWVDALGHEGISYTPDAAEAVRLVDAGEAEVAVLLRPTLIEDVQAVARRGDVMPQKSTYFFPKLVSGLLFHPV